MTKSKPEQRCSWCGENDLYVAYHDLEWGVPLHDDQKLFEFLGNHRLHKKELWELVRLYSKLWK